MGPPGRQGSGRPWPAWWQASRVPSAASKVTTPDLPEPPRSGGDVDHHPDRAGQLQDPEAGAVVEADADADHALPVLGQAELADLGQGRGELVGHGLGARPVVVAGRALEGGLDEGVALQGEELVVGLAEGDLADVADPVGGDLGPLELER